MSYLLQLEQALNYLETTKQKNDQTQFKIEQPHFIYQPNPLLYLPDNPI